MSYIKGTLEVGDENSYYRGKVFLPHSCDEWVIGGKEEAENLIEDLQEALKKLNN